MRRFTRLTNAFSKKLENHTAAVSLYSCTTILSASHDPKSDACDGRWRDRTPLGYQRCNRAAREYRAELAEEKKVENRRRIEQSYSQIGDALGGGSVRF